MRAHTTGIDGRGGLGHIVSMAPQGLNKPFADFREMIARWPSRSALASELGVEHWLVEAWHRKNSIPPRWFDAVVRAAIKRDIEGVSTEVLLRLHMKRVEEGPPRKGKKSELAAGVEA